MRYQRNSLKGSRPELLGHPRASTHTLLSYHTKYKDRQTPSFLRRCARLARREKAAS